MKGSIRVIGGLIVTIAAAGGVDNATDAQLPIVILIAAIGLGIMYSGVKAMKTA
jgi:hypothetical protein